MRIATWNVNSLKARLPRVEEFLGYADVDVLCLQETKLADKAFPALTFSGARLRVGAQRPGPVERRRDPVARRHRRTSPTASTTRTSIPTKATRGSLAADCGGIRVVSVYVPNGREVGTEFYDRKLRVAADAARLDRRDAHARRSAGRARRLQRRARRPRRVGPEEVRRRDARDRRPSARPSRGSRSGAWRTLFRRVYPDADRLYSYWDYRAGDFHQHRGMRIDLVLATQPVAERVTWAVVDRNARKGTGPSDHAPVIIDLAD